MRVLHLIGAAEDSGGILAMLRSLQRAPALREWRHTVWVNAAYRETRQPALDYRYSRHLRSECDPHLRLAWHAWRALGELRALLQREPFDLLHAHSRGALLVAMMVATRWRRRVLFTSHGRGKRTWLYARAGKLRRLYVVPLTHEMARHYRLREDPPRIQIISACCADAFFSAPLVPPRFTPAGSLPLRLAGVGNIVRWKNWDLALRALALLPAPDRRRVKFTLWGPVVAEPDARRFAAELRRLIAAEGLGDQVELAGPTNAIGEAIQAADWLLHPTTNEPCSVGLMEGLALGRPAVVSASGGSVEIVAHGKTGLHFAPGSAEDLAAKLGMILRGEPQLLPPAAIRESVRPRSATCVAEAYARLYGAILGAEPPPPA